MSFEDDLITTLESLKDFLIAKNALYGNSALEPLNIFSKSNGSGIEQRIDDKLSRIKNSDKLRKNDVVDLTGYLILLLIRQGWSHFNDLLDED